MRRMPAVSGQFYNGTAARLKEQVAQYIIEGAVKEKVLGAVVPHAGLIYSGPVAGAVYSSIVFPKTFLLLGPNHTGLGPAVSLMDGGEWEIPTGVFEIDKKLAARLALNTPLATRDAQAHMFEHSLEVQLPFISHLSKDVRIVPVAILSATIDECMELARAVADAVRSVNYPVVILASSDMSHYLPAETAKQKDRKAIERMLSLDPEGLYKTVREERITMCGYLPATVMLAACKLLGAGSARLVKYATSGDISGDYDSVVGYAGIVVR